MFSLVLMGLVGACSPERLEVVECASACSGAGNGTGGASGGASPGAAGDNSAEGGSGAVDGDTRFHAALVHRYDFEGEGTVVLDRVGTAHGQLIGTELTRVGERGAAVLAGRNSGQYIELPSGIVSELSNATFEAWVTWNGDTVWERVFDFGDRFLAEDERWYGFSYLFLTPRTPREIGAVVRVAQQRAEQPELIMDGDRALPTDVLTHVALVVDNSRNVLELFLDGEHVTSQGIVDHMEQSFDALATLNDTGNWLGRSQYEQDAFFGGSFHEFRIYEAALTPAEIAASYERGPDPEPEPAADAG